MKLYKLFSIAAAAALTATGCDDLDLAHTEKISSVSMWSTEEYTDAGIAGLFNVFNPNNYGTVNTDPRSYAGYGRFLRCEALSYTSYGIHDSYLQSASLNAKHAYFSLETV